VAIRDAILTAQRAGTSIEDALHQAIIAGIPPIKNAFSDAPLIAGDGQVDAQASGCLAVPM